MTRRILKINKVEGSIINCVFNNGEYRIVDLTKFVDDHSLQDSADLLRLITSDHLNVLVKNGTLTFPDLQKKIQLKSGKEFIVDYDLDPIMLYDSSIPDETLNSTYQIGAQLKKARKRAGITQEELAQKVGTSKGYISRIENNRTDIALKTLRRIVEVGLNKRLLIAD